MTYEEAEKIVKWCNEHKWESDRPLTQRQVEAYKIWLRGKE